MLRQHDSAEVSPKVPTKLYSQHWARIAESQLSKETVFANDMIVRCPARPQGQCSGTYEAPKWP